MENNRFYAKSGGQFKSRITSGGVVAAQWFTGFEKLKSANGDKFSQSVLTPVLQFYRQNQIFTIAGSSLLFLILLVLILAASAGNNAVISPPSHVSQHDNRHDSKSQNNNDIIFSPQDNYTKIKYNLEIIALSIVQSDNWNKQHIVDFAYSWNELDHQQKAKVKQTVWFQLLENALVNIVSTERTDSGGYKNDRTRLLAILSDKLNIAIPNVIQTVASNSAASTASGHDSSDSNSENRSGNKSGNESKNNEPTLEEQDVAVAKNPVTQIVEQPASDNAANAISAAHDEQLAKLEKELFKQKAAQPNPAPQESTVPQPTNSEMAAAEVNPMSAPVLAASGQPELLPLPQEADDMNNAVVDQPRPSLHKVIRTPPPADAVAIDEFAKNNNPTAVSGNQITTSKSGPISDADLSKITSQLISSYEKGNIDSFASLFAPNAVSNDEADLKTIKKDYADLFAATSDRRMIIGGIKWNFSNNTATGDGQMEVAVKPNGANKTQKYTGKIQIVVEKQSDGVQITRLFHALK